MTAEGVEEAAQQQALRAFAVRSPAGLPLRLGDGRRTSCSRSSTASGGCAPPETAASRYARRVLLYSNPVSTNALKVRFLLAELGLDYDTREVPLSQPRPDWYLR